MSKRLGEIIGCKDKTSSWQCFVLIFPHFLLFLFFSLLSDHMRKGQDLPYIACNEVTMTAWLGILSPSILFGFYCLHYAVNPP